MSNPNDFVNVKDFGALGNAVVATDCSMVAGQDVLTSQSARFHNSDTGKVIAVYDAGKPTTITGPHGTVVVQPLSSRIKTFLSPTQVQLADKAKTSTPRSSRVVCGHDDTAAIQKALDKLAASNGSDGNLGGVLIIPRGHYLTRGLIMDGAVTGILPKAIIPVTHSINVTKTYNGIWLQGSGQGDSILENWDIDVPTVPYHGMISLNWIADPAAPNRRLTNIIISDLTIRQVYCATQVVNAIADQFSEHVQIRDCEIISGSYEGVVMSGNSARWRVSGCNLHDCGLGGPAWGNALSALNPGGSDWIAKNNVISDSGQGIEMGNHDGRVVNNEIYAPTVGLLPVDYEVVGINIQSAGTGSWDNEILNNLFVGWTAAPIQIGNSIGVACRSLIQGNHLIDCGYIHIESGQETNSIGPNPPSIIHGTTIIKDNVMTMNTVNNYGFRLGGLAAQSGLESVILEGNVVFVAYEKPAGAVQVPVGFLAVTGHYGGGDYWLPNHLYQKDDLVVPNPEPANPTKPSDYYYRCVGPGTSGVIEPVWNTPTPNAPAVPTPDNGIQWACFKRPFVRLRNNTLTALTGATSRGLDVRIDDEAVHEIMGLPLDQNNLWGNYQLGYYPWNSDPNGVLQPIAGCR
jgi:hypothetical protein